MDLVLRIRVCGAKNGQKTKTAQNCISAQKPEDILRRL
jgi:hypothetical protein